MPQVNTAWVRCACGAEPAAPITLLPAAEHANKQICMRQARRHPPLRRTPSIQYHTCRMCRQVVSHLHVVAGIGGAIVAGGAIAIAALAMFFGGAAAKG